MSTGSRRSWFPDPVVRPECVVTRRVGECGEAAGRARPQAGNGGHQLSLALVRPTAVRTRAGERGTTLSATGDLAKDRVQDFHGLSLNRATQATKRSNKETARGRLERTSF